MVFVGIVTCNRSDFFKKCYNSIKNAKNVDFLAVVNDGEKDVELDAKDIYIKNRKNLGVGKSKNLLFKKALELNCNHIFIIEDDIIVKDHNVFNEYIKASQLTGIEHFCFGYHGPANKNGISGGKPYPKYVIDYGNVKIAINTHSVGAFCYYSKNVLKNVGLIDEEFHNAFEHVEHSYRIAKEGYTTPYWNWADIWDSTNLLDEIQCSEQSSTIRPRNDWKENIIKGANLFQKKHGYSPAWQNAVPDISEKELRNQMKSIFSRKDITLLENVTIVGMDCIHPEACVEAMRISSEKIKFGRKIFFSHKKPKNMFDGLEFIQINEIKNLFEYCEFVLYKLPDHIQSEFCLIVHADGYVTNPKKWNPSFLNYDYIGSPWPKNDDPVYSTCRVGNGGFSLRSKKLLDACKQLNHALNSNEDVLICKVYKRALEQIGIKFAPLELASTFAQELVLDDINVDVEKDCFGFHGKAYTKFHEKSYNRTLSAYQEVCSELPITST